MKRSIHQSTSGEKRHCPGPTDSGEPTDSHETQSDGLADEITSDSESDISVSDDESDVPDEESDVSDEESGISDEESGISDASESEPESESDYDDDDDIDEDSHHATILTDEDLRNFKYEKEYDTVGQANKRAERYLKRSLTNEVAVTDDTKSIDDTNTHE